MPGARLGYTLQCDCCLRSFDEIYPSIIQNHSLPVSTHMQSLKKIGQKLHVLKLESGNEQNAIFNINQGP